MKSLLKFGAVLLSFGLVLSMVGVVIVRAHAVPEPASEAVSKTPNTVPAPVTNTTNPTNPAVVSSAPKS